MQYPGLGGLRPNTVAFIWPNDWNMFEQQQTYRLMHLIHSRENTFIGLKNVENLKDISNQQLDIDVWKYSGNYILTTFFKAF